MYISKIVALFELQRSGDDPCQYERRSPEGLLLLVLIYVDDILVTAAHRVR